MTELKTVQALVALAKQAGASVYQNRHFPGEPAVSFGNESWARFCALIEQMQREALVKSANPANAGQAVQPVAWYEFNESVGAWFLAYSCNPNAKTRPLYVAPQPAPEPQQDQLQQPDDMNPWQRAIDDELICCFLGTTETPEYTDPRRALRALIYWHTEVALDPQVSTEAQALIDQGRAQQDDHAGSLTPSANPFIIKQLIDEKNAALDMVRRLEEELATIEYDLAPSAESSKELHYPSGKTAEELWMDTGRLRSQLADMKAQSSKAALSDDAAVYGLYRIAMYGDRGNTQKTMDSIRAILALLPVK